MTAWTREWENRVRKWSDALEKLLFRELDDIAWEAFITSDPLSPEQAARGKFEPMAAGTAWGAPGEYGWFRTTITVPPEADGERLVAMINTGSEVCIWVNGQPRGGRSLGDTRLELTRSAKAGESIEILCECFKRVHVVGAAGGPLVPGHAPVTEVPAPQAEVGKSSYGIWDEDVFQLHLDILPLRKLLEHLPASSARRTAIESGLCEMTLEVDPELPRQEFLETVRRAREHLAPLLAAKNPSGSREAYCFGHGHLDIAWKWTLAQGANKMMRTTAQQLELLEMYPEHRFLQPQPALYEMLRARNAELFEALVAAVREGRILAEGGMWVEADTNMSGGESLIRQCVYGRQYYRDELGVDSVLLWLPDAFGYSGALPQIARGCGIEYFVTAKLRMNYAGADDFPYDTFTWEGIDGSTLPTHLLTGYSSEASPSSILAHWDFPLEQAQQATKLHPFGWGDGGGGPVREHIEIIRRLRDLEGVPRARIASPVDWFMSVYPDDWPEERYVGELYLSAHRGVLTSQARVKQLNRQCEIALREAEMWSSIAVSLTSHTWREEEIAAAWKQVLLNQFHDILPGSCTRNVAEEARGDYEVALAVAEGAATEARAALTGDTSGSTVFNSLGWRRRALVPVDGDVPLADSDGNAITTQAIGEQRYADVEIPSCGWTSIRPSEETDAPSQASDVRVTEDMIENDLLRVSIDESGGITSVIDKENGEELLAGVSNQLMMYRDSPSYWDAWDIDSMYPLTPVELDQAAKLTPVSSGPLCGVLMVERTLQGSSFAQDIVLRQGSRLIEFDTMVDWRETHKMLKVGFDLDVHANEAVHEIQFGHIRRPNHRSRHHDGDRFEVCNQRWTALVEEGRGAAVLNDCKYGVNVDGKHIGLTLLRSPVCPDATADRDVHRFRYAVYFWDGPFMESELVRKGYELNVPVHVAEGGSGERSLFSVDAPNIVLETIKPAFDGSGDIVVRLYESMRTRTSCSLQTTLPVSAAISCNMMEEPDSSSPLTCEDGAVRLQFRPFEIKTVRIVDRTMQVAQHFQSCHAGGAGHEY